MPWWAEIHGDSSTSSLGVPIPLDCAGAVAEEPVLIKNGFDGFHATRLHDTLRQRGVDTVVIIGLITRCHILLFSQIRDINEIVYSKFAPCKVS